MQRRVARNHARVKLHDAARAAVGQPRAHGDSPAERARPAWRRAPPDIFRAPRRLSIRTEPAAPCVPCRARESSARERSKSSRFSPTSSLMRRPQPYSSSNIKQVALRMRALQTVRGDAHRPASLVCSAVGTDGHALRSLGRPHQPRDVRRHGAFAQPETETATAPRPAFGGSRRRSSARSYRSPSHSRSSKHRNSAAARAAAGPAARNSRRTAPDRVA